jgi:hypothetical protein
MSSTTVKPNGHGLCGDLVAKTPRRLSSPGGLTSRPVPLRPVKPEDDDYVGESLSVLQTLLELAEYLYLRDIVATLHPFPHFFGALVWRVDHPYRPQLRTVPIVHGSRIAGHVIHSSHYTTSSQHTRKEADSHPPGTDS